MLIRTLGPKGGGFGAVPHRLEEGKSASEYAGPRRGVDYDVPHWLGRTPKGVDCDVPHWL